MVDAIYCYIQNLSKFLHEKGYKIVAIKAIILARVSTDDQMAEGQSIPAQIEKARQYVQRKGLEIKSEHQFDESSLKDQRTKFERVIDEIKKPLPHVRERGFSSRMAPPRGLEPRTGTLTACCSTN